METSRNIIKEQPKDKFPITVKKGHAAVKIYQVKNPEAVNYCVSYIGPTGRQRRNFADLDVPKREAVNVAQHLASGDMEALKLTGREKQIYVEAERAIGGLVCRCIQSLMNSRERTTTS